MLAPPDVGVGQFHSCYVSLDQYRFHFMAMPILGLKGLDDALGQAGVDLLVPSKRIPSGSGPELTCSVSDCRTTADEELLGGSFLVGSIRATALLGLLNLSLRDRTKILRYRRPVTA